MKTTRYTWLLLPLLLAGVIVSTIVSFQLPLFLNVFDKSKLLFTLFSERELADELPQQINNVRHNIQRLEKIILTLDSSNNNPAPLTDVLYPYAEESKFTLNKIETGNPLPVENVHETPVTLRGKGTYESVGSFVAHIENSSHSTRIRQLLMKNTDNNQIDVVMEFVIIGE